ncbi:MAG: transposase [Legionellaceae bacterium]|nr:transposase [Legionellaceae bacterium]
MGENDTGFSSLSEVLFEKGLEVLGSAVEISINEAMKIERDKHLNARSYERTELRSGYANGFKTKQLNARLGALNLHSMIARYAVYLIISC